MARRIKPIVLDAWAIMAYLEDEPAGAKVADIIADARESAIPLMMTVVNLGEVWYILAREVSETEAERSVAEVKGLGIEIVEIDWKLTRTAASFKAKHKMSFADCFAAALAREINGTLVTGDPEFKQVDSLVSVRFVNER